MKTNLFNAMHTIEVTGEKIRIVEMTDEHLINTLNVILRKKPLAAMAAARKSMMEGFAPDNLDRRTARLLGMKPMSSVQKEEVLKRLDELEDDIYIRAIDFATPYLLVALSRDNTYKGARALLKDATGIDAQVVVPKWEAGEHVPELPEVAGVPQEWLEGDYEAENFVDETLREIEFVDEEDYD